METTQITTQPLALKLGYPWLALTSTLIWMAYALLVNSGEFALELGLPPSWLQPHYLVWAGVAVLMLYWWEYRRYQRRFRQLKQQIQQLWHSRQQLQQRAQLATGHTDKLKMFISDKLLEYLEYDEKYLHFKSIAKEVRHNGVISFDKVLQALTLAQQQSDDGEIYQQAQASMRYLWDLLDLSTADNMALHIATKVSQLEELLYQAELNQTALQQLPIQPLFSPEQALLSTLTQHLGAQFSLPAEPLGSYQCMDSAEQFELHISPCSELVGNANHLILLLENLLKNAQYFAGLNEYASSLAGVVVKLNEVQQCLHISIYNRGPHIQADNPAHLFQLGYSTRQSQGHHGKGLGLYFAQQIAQGFDGTLAFENVENHQDELYLRLEFQNGEVQHLHLQQQLQDGMPVLTQAQQNTTAASAVFTLELQQPLAGLEFSSQRFTSVHKLALDQQQQWLQGQDYKHWQLELTQQSLVIQAVDVRGVLCRVHLPTYQGRQHGIGAAAREVDVASLNSQFQLPEDF